VVVVDDGGGDGVVGAPLVPHLVRPLNSWGQFWKGARWKLFWRVSDPLCLSLSIRTNLGIIILVRTKFVLTRIAFEIIAKPFKAALFKESIKRVFGKLHTSGTDSIQPIQCGLVIQEKKKKSFWMFLVIRGFAFKPRKLWPQNPICVN
jgi:hypothetical protein